MSGGNKQNVNAAIDNWSSFHADNMRTVNGVRSRTTSFNRMQLNRTRVQNFDSIRSP